ncbi:MAG TPA: glycosyltransferase family 2 protein [Solirubrobacteraceae bacterium]|nr:glycosyltransferase family 2 protein [Solirubrobacteraceae bacterium]
MAGLVTDTVAVIICAHLEERFTNLLDAMRSLNRQTRRPDEVVVVIDGNAPLARRLQPVADGACVVELSQPSGLAAARNAGVAASSSGIVLFLDDDAIAHTEWVERLTATIDDPRVLGASGYSAPIWGAERPAWLPDEFLWVLGCSYAGQPRQRARVRNVYGGCCGLRRSLFTELGGYDVRLGRSNTSHGGGEEAELCVRAQRRWPGSHFEYEPSAQIDHLVPAARLTLRYVLRRSYDEGKMKATVAWLHPGALTPEVSFARNLPCAFARCIGSGLVLKRGAMARAGGMAAMALAVIAGLIVGRVGHLLAPSRRKEPA